MQCPVNQHYTQSKSRCHKTCENMYTLQSPECQDDPLEGCECDQGLVLDEGECIQAVACPCNFKGGRLLPGSKGKDDCREW